MVVRKSSVGKGEFRGGPGGPGPPFCRYLIFQHYMSNMESRRLLTVICMERLAFYYPWLNLSVQNAVDCISENFSLKNFPRGACARNSLEKGGVRSPDGRYRAHIVTVY